MLNPLRALLPVCLFLCAAPVLQAAPPPPPPPLPVKSYILVDATSNQVLAANGDSERVDPASLTKLMTSYVVFQVLKDGKLKLDQKVTISEHAWRVGGAKSDGSTSFMDLGSQVAVVDLLQGMIVQSGNDATIALAEAVANSENTFALVMNQYSDKLGLTGSHWTNASGLPDPAHYTTARDVAFLSTALIREFPQYYKWYSQRSFTYHNIKQDNRNGLLERDATVDGIKTGHTDAAGFCLAASAVRDGMRLVSVVMHAASQKAREEASEALLGYGFSFFETRRLYAANQPVGNAHVWKVSDPVPVITHQEMWATAPRGDLARATAVLYLKKKVVAPVSAGEPVGRLRVTRDGALVAEVPVYPQQAVVPSGLWRRMLDTVHLWFN
jgi:serine-type D-Ala-D-Ala carboxypeptidase (penicillin-binding protein 5/6)